MTAVDWYFDYVSGYAYLQYACLHRLPDDVEVTYRPVLFAGLLGHFGQLGPAEIPQKRRFTYRQWVWLAERMDIPFKMPPAHPFNPLGALRLTHALGCSAEAVGAVFRFIYCEGRSVEDPDELARLGAELGVKDVAARIGDPAIKDALRAETEAATARGVFGVPALAIGDELCWGLDATDMALDYLEDPELFGRGELKRASETPIGTARKR
jgi:2-hydroxychromene-2-carboxylate isomerase